MAIQTTDTAASPEAQPLPARPSRPVSLPPDMEGWLSGQEAAEMMGMEKRRFQDHAARHAFPRRRIGGVGKPTFYDPQVIRSAVEAQAARAADHEAEAAEERKVERERKNELKRQQGTGVAPSAAPQPSAADLFHLEALAVLGQIVQQHGRAMRPR